MRIPSGTAYRPHRLTCLFCESGELISLGQGVAPGGAEVDRQPYPQAAARGGLEQRRYAWGDELKPEGEWRCNIWQGTFPSHNTLEDSYLGPAPVGEFQPNGYGLYNVSGNVWEWCSDWFATTIHNRGPHEDPTGPPFGQAKVMRGGSCHDSYCNRYRVAARSSNTPDSSTGNIGFRCVKNVALETIPV